MSGEDDQTQPKGGEDVGAPSDNGVGFTPEQQAYFDRVLEYRLRRHRADMTEVERLRERAGQVDRLEARVHTLERERDTARQEAQRHAERADSSTLRAEVMGAATRAGAVDPDDVFRLLPEGAVKLEEGKVVGAEEAVKALSERKAHLFGGGTRRPSGGDGGARADGGAPPGRGSDMSQLMRRSIGIGN